MIICLKHLDLNFKTFFDTGNYQSKKKRAINNVIKDKMTGRVDIHFRETSIKVKLK